MSRPFALVLASALVVTACSSSTHTARPSESPSAAPVASTRVAAADPQLAALRYGAVPTRNPAVTYQPDVVIVDGGASAIRSVSGDGLTWTIRGDAGHARDLAVGKILFVTSRSAGRILAVRPSANDLAVTIGPVQLTDVIKKADVSYDQPLDPTKMIFYPAPDQPGDGDVSPVQPGPSAGPSASAPASAPPGSAAASVPASASASVPASAPASVPASAAPSATSDASAVAMPPMALAADSVTGLLPLPSFGSAGASIVRGMSLRPVAGLDGLGTQFDYRSNGILLHGKAVLHLDHPTLQFHLVIDDGVTYAHMTLDGAAGLSLALNAAINAQNLQEYKDRFDLPIDISIPIGGLVPLTITIRQSMEFRTGFGAKQATLNGAADLKLSGGFGVSYSSGRLNLEAPLSFSGIHQLTESITGDSLGVNAILVDYQIRVVVGIGAFGFAAGPSFVLVSTVGLTNTATEAAVPCRHADLNVRMGVGLGYSLPTGIVKSINFFLGLLNIKAINASGGSEHFEKLIGASESQPNTDGCRI